MPSLYISLLRALSVHFTAACPVHFTAATLYISLPQPCTFHCRNPVDFTAATLYISLLSLYISLLSSLYISLLYALTVRFIAAWTMYTLYTLTAVCPVHFTAATLYISLLHAVCCRRSGRGAPVPGRAGAVPAAGQHRVPQVLGGLQPRLHVRLVPRLHSCALRRRRARPPQRHHQRLRQLPVSGLQQRRQPRLTCRRHQRQRSA